ncbi:MAG: hypothetical protein FJW31_19750 [Acidobacteria bacterium]|nr:hypothetical protein [Acidobacteriota bacterium]
MKLLLSAALALLCAAMLAPAQTVDIGSGPVSETIRREFLRSYYRGSFQNLTTLPPVADVRRFGSTGLVQEFNAVTGGTANNPLRYALVRANSLDSAVVQGVDTVLQMSPALYSYLQSVGVNTAGYPTTDTATCPAIESYVCTYQLFDKNHALFVFNAGNQNGTNFNIKDPFFTRWRQVGIGALGPAINAEETAIASGAATGAVATVQRFALGALYNMTAGTLSGRLLLVSDPVYRAYAANRAEAGFLGMPLTEVQTLANGRRRQTFEGGAIEYDLGQTPELRLPVGSVIVTGSSITDRLNLGETVTLRAQTYSANGSLLDGRPVSWVTTNSRVLAIEQSSAQSATIRAVGGGTANITAVSEGRFSRAVTYFVTAPCCQIGEGAPTTAIQQSFADAVTRNRLSVRIPSPSPVRRVGTGFIQELAPADPNSTARYLLARSDAGSNTFVVTGATLVRYLELGGPGGALGYPLADASTAGRQLFAGGALGGSPVQLVAAPILTRWQQQNYEAGPAGLPRGPVEQVLSFAATLGLAQPFTGGVYVAHQTGSLTNRAFLVSGLVLAKYQSLGGAAGTMGLPTGDEFVTSGRRRQDFEGGLLTYAPGDAEATVEERQRRPQISATPGTVAAGSRIRIAAGGFDQGATLRITVGSQPDFVVQTQTGAFAWELFVPASAPSGLVNLRAADVNNTRALAAGSYVVQSGAEVLTDVTIVSGNLQSGVPGARLPQPLEVLVTDENRVPLVGVPVRWDASPGAQIEAAVALTDERGRARAFLRLALAESPALATAASGRDIVTFAATSRAGALPNFPRLNQTGLADDPNLGNEAVRIADAGALLVSAASMLRYYQGTGELGSPNGPADPPLLNRFLREFCVFDAQGVRVCDGFIGRPSGAGEKNVNPWRLAAFVNGSLDIANVPITAETRVNPIRDALGQNAPVLLALALGSEAGAETAHFIVAIGVGSTGEILVHDPNPALRRATLNEYLQRPRTRLAAALRFAPRAASALGFLVVTTTAEADVTSPAGACGFSVSWPAPGTAGGIEPLRFRSCDGQQPSYQLTLAGSGDEPFLVTDLGTVASRYTATASLPGTFALSRPASNWTLAAQQAAFTAASVLNAATFTPALSPGTLASVFGSGLALPGRSTRVFLDGDEATVLASTPFQVNFQIPPSAQPGAHTLRIESPFGGAEQVIELDAVSPAVFTLGGNRGAILNQEGTVNSITNPARRGGVIVVYGTGFGALRAQGALQVTAAPVTGAIEGVPLQAAYAGAAPGFPGLYQINLSLPSGLPPGLAVRLTLAIQGVQAQPVVLAVQ